MSNFSRLALWAVVTFCAALPAAPALAHSGIGTSKTIGIGIEAGHGAGLSLKFQPTPGHAFQFGAYGYDYGRYRTHKAGKYYYGYDYGYSSGSFLLHGDYLLTQANLNRTNGLSLPWYAGLGVDLGFGVGAALGVHGNLGLAAQFGAIPIDLFIEWTPRLWIVDFFQVHPFDFNGGVRIWF